MELELDDDEPGSFMATQRFRRLTDLFVRGRELELPDGSLLWVQAINAYERDECISDAQVARSRLVMALKDKGDERLKIQARLAERGREAMEADLVEAKVEEKYPEIVAALEDDPDWSERVTILKRTDFTQVAKPAEQAERDIVDKIFSDWTGAIQDRLGDERAWQVAHYRRASDDELLEDYLDTWLDRRGTEVASAEYGLTEMWYATRYCEAFKGPDGQIDHARCEGHTQRVFDSKAEARGAPEQLQQLVQAVLAELMMAARDPKGSARAASSSDSSPTPSEAGESTPSTPTETPNAPPGTSPQLSVMH